MIKPPFKVSEILRDPHDRKRVRAFLVDLRKTYHGWVEEARRLAAARS